MFPCLCVYVCVCAPVEYMYVNVKKRGSKDLNYPVFWLFGHIVWEDLCHACEF